MSVRRLFSTLLLVPLFTAVGASATSLGGSTSKSLGAGEALIARCDTSVNAALVVSGTTITAVNITDVAVPACVGGQLQLVVTANGTEITRGGPVTITASSIVVPVMAADGVGATDVRVVVVGP